MSEPAGPLSPYLDAATAGLLHRLRLFPRRPVAGRTVGMHRSSRLGHSLEFADYRDYAPGDDPRRLDWRALARFDRPFVRQFADERDRTVHLLIDGSRSMGFDGKGARAVQLAAALAYAALRAGDRVELVLLRDGQPALLARGRGRAGAAALARGLARCDAWDGRTALFQALRSWAGGAAAAGHAAGVPGAFRPGRGIAFLLSDLMDPAAADPDDGSGRALAGVLTAAAGEGAVIHILSPAEQEPDFAAGGGSPEWTLIDSERDERRELTVDAAVLTAYRNTLRRWLSAWREGCSAAGAAYAQVDAAQPLRAVLLGPLARAGVLA